MRQPDCHCRDMQLSLWTRPALGRSSNTGRGAHLLLEVALPHLLDVLAGGGLEGLVPTRKRAHIRHRLRSCSSHGSWGCQRAPSPYIPWLNQSPGSPGHPYRFSPCGKAQHVRCGSPLVQGVHEALPLLPHFVLLAPPARQPAQRARRQGQAQGEAATVPQLLACSSLGHPQCPSTWPLPL